MGRGASIPPFAGKTDIISKKIAELVKIGKREFTLDPFKKGTKELKSDAVYVAGKSNKTKYIYVTDRKGRITEAYARPLNKWDGERPPHDRNTPNKLPGDHAGHIFANIFGGSDKLDNLLSQASHVNLSDMRKLENDWKAAMKEGDVTVDARIEYGKDGRPLAFNFEWWIDGEPQLPERFANIPKG